MKNIIIVAHPDDEAIWFSSILRKRDTALFFCFQNKYLPNQKENLKYTNKVFEIIKLYENILPTIWLQTIKTTKPRIFGKVSPATKKHLEGNLYSILKITSPKKIYTHNPYGEYGHSEHVLVHQILKKIAGYKLIFPSPQNKTSLLFKKAGINQVDIHFRETLFNWYKKRGIWTGVKGEPYGEKEEFYKYKR